MTTLQPFSIDEKTTPQDFDRIIRNLFDVVREQQQLPIVPAKPITGIRLEDGKPTPVPHGLGRRALVFISAPRGVGAAAGSVVELRDGSADSSKYFTLLASGWGAEITVDVLVL